MMFARLQRLDLQRMQLGGMELRMLPSSTQSESKTRPCSRTTGT
jgi:hypothetical protein